MKVYLLAFVVYGYFSPTTVHLTVYNSAELCFQALDKALVENRDAKCYVSEVKEKL